MNNDIIAQNNEISQDASNVPNQPKSDQPAAEKRPISEARLAANRANAQKSTGPAPPKANSAPA